MIIHNPVITGSLQVNGSSVSSIEQLDNVSGSVAALNNATSSYLQNTTDTLTGDLTVTGTLTAQDLHVQEITSSIVYSSGSNIFGNDSTNTHTFTGTVSIGDGSTSGTLKFENDIKTRKVVLYQGADNDNEFYGFGVENSTLVYSVYTTSDDHVFFSGYSGGRNELMRIGGDGNVGIGTSSPVRPLHINSTNTPQLIIQNVDGGTNAERIGIELDSGDIFRIKSLNDNNTVRTNNIITGNILTGKVGIGSATPEEKLTIDGTSSGAYLRISNVASGDISSGIMIYNGSNLDTQIYTNPTFGNTTFLTREKLAIRAGGSERLTIATNGNVGINSTTPTARFQVVEGATDEVTTFSVTSAGQVEIARNHSTSPRILSTFGSGNAQLNFYKSGTLVSSLGNAAASYFGGGSVGIGTTTPSNPLHIYSSENEGLYVQGSGGGNWINFKAGSSNLWSMGTQTGLMGWYNRTDSSYKMVITDGGLVGINTTAPNANARLHVVGTGRFESTIGTGDNVRVGLGHWDTTSQTAGVGGQIVLGYKYTDAGTYTEGAILKMYKENSTSGHYGSGLKFQVRNTGNDLSTKMILTPDGDVGFGQGNYNGGVYAILGGGVDQNWGLQIQRTDGVNDYNTRMKFYPENGSTRKLGFWNANAGEWMGYFDGSTSSDNRFIINGGDVGIGTTDPKTKLQVNGPIGMKNDSAGDPINARLVKTGTTSVLFTIKVGAVGAWRAGHAFLKVSGAQNGLQEHHSAWYHLKLVHYYLSGVTQSGTSNPALIKDSGGDTGNYTLSVTATNNADPQEISINISDSNGTTDSMIADIDCSFYQGIKDIY